MKDLPHVASRVFGTPLMIARAKLEVILGVLAPRFSGGPIQPVDPAGTPAPMLSITPERIAVVSVIGTLVSRSGYLDASSGLLSYADIGDAIALAMDDPSVRGVVLDVDSPGGEVGGLFDLVDRIEAIKAASGKPLWAVANESALSAAYAIASTADRLYVTRTGELGSIGVVAVHIDESGADAKSGLAWSFVFAGDQKVDGNAHEPLSARARATIQADVDRLYAEFCDLVAENRGLRIEAVRGTNAAVYRGELAVRVGLADQIGTLDAAIVDMASEFELAAMSGRNTPTPIHHKRSPSMATNETERYDAQASEPELLPALAMAPSPEPSSEPASSPLHAPAAFQPLAAFQAPAAPQTPAPAQWLPSAALSQSAVEPDPAERLREEYAEIASLAAQAIRLGVNIDAADAMRRGVSATDLRRSILDTLAARAEATRVIAAAPSTPVAGDSPIVRRARQRAVAAQA